MQEDSLVETQGALKNEDPNGNFYGTNSNYTRHAFQIIIIIVVVTTECPRGHKYFIGNVSHTLYYQSRTIITIIILFSVW